MKEKIKKGIKNKFLGISEPSDDKTKSLIKLIIGLVFMFSIFILVKANYDNQLSNQNNQSNEDIKELSLKEIFDKYKTNYNYDITIVDNNSYIYYKGKVENEENFGKRIIDAEELNYKKTYEGAFNTNTNEKIDNLYKNYLYIFFNPNNLYDYLIYLNPTESKENNLKIYEYKSVYNNMEIDIKLTTTIESIQEINYNYNNITYNIRLSL